MRPGLLALSGFTLSILSPAATADSPASELDFSLQVEHHETRWQYAGQTVTSKSSILGVRMQERLAPRLTGSLHVGYLDLSQPDNPLPAAQTTSGYYGGIELNWRLLDSQWLRVDLGGGYRYQETTGQNSGTEVELVWHDTYAQLGLGIPLSERLTLQTAGGTSRTSGEQRVSGNTTQLLTFEEDQQAYYSAGLAYWLDGTGYLSATWLGGGYDGFRFSFHREF